MNFAEILSLSPCPEVSLSRYIKYVDGKSADGVSEFQQSVPVKLPPSKVIPLLVTESPSKISADLSKSKQH